MIEQLLFVLVGAVIGICGGFVAQYVHTKMWLNKDIEKVKSLLLYELDNIYKILNAEENYFRSILKDSKGEFHLMCTAQKPVDDALLIFDLSRLRFLAWDTLVSSGALFKLEKNDILVLQTIQHSVCKHDSDLNEARKKFEAEFTKQIHLLGYERLVSNKHDLFTPYVKKCCKVINGTLITLKEELDRLDWFDCKKVSKTELNPSRYGSTF